MPGQRSKQQQKARAQPRPSWWKTVEKAAEEAGLRGHRQWGMVRFVARLGNSKNTGRTIMIGSRKLAELLGLDVGRRPADAEEPQGQGKHDLDGRNTRRRLARINELGVFRVESPRYVSKSGRLARARGGRKPGCTIERLQGRALRVYPGPLVYPKVLIEQQVELDNLADANLIPWTRLRTPREQLTPGEILELEQLAQLALRRRGPP